MSCVELSEANRRALDHIRAQSQPGAAPAADITMYFSPDRLLADGRSVAERASFTFPDSVMEPTAVGVTDAFGLVETALRERMAATGGTLEQRDYVEVQVHGPIELARDAEALVADAA